MKMLDYIDMAETLELLFKKISDYFLPNRLNEKSCEDTSQVSDEHEYLARYHL